MKLLEPTNIGDLQLANRIIMAPMTRCRAGNPDRMPTGLHAEYYAQRHQAGLIISEGLAVSPMGIGYVNTPGIYSQEQLQAWQIVTRAIHDAGGKIFAQLWHVGRISHPDFLGGKKPLAPSPINPLIKVKVPDGQKKSSEVPEAMSINVIHNTIHHFKQAAQNAMDAGFDGVEIHSSNGYLFHQFFSNSANQRTDKYGGSIKNKSRFLFETLESIISVVDAHRIGIRLNPFMNGSGGINVDPETLPTFEFIVRKLNLYHLAYLHLSRPSARPESTHGIKDLAGHFRKIYKGHLMMNGGYNRDTAESLVKTRNADSVSFGRLFISNPDLPERFRNNLPLSEADPATFYTSGKEGYTTYMPYGIKS